MTPLASIMDYLVLDVCPPRYSLQRLLFASILVATPSLLAIFSIVFRHRAIVYWKYYAVHGPPTFYSFLTRLPYEGLLVAIHSIAIFGTVLNRSPSFPGSVHAFLSTVDFNAVLTWKSIAWTSAVGLWWVLAPKFMNDEYYEQKARTFSSGLHRPSNDKAMLAADDVTVTSTQLTDFEKGTPVNAVVTADATALNAAHTLVRLQFSVLVCATVLLLYTCNMLDECHNDDKDIWDASISSVPKFTLLWTAFLGLFIFSFKRALDFARDEIDFETLEMK